jgi:hypothetical protein
MKISLLVFAGLILVSCAATHKDITLLRGANLRDAPVCLEDTAKIPSFFERFYKTRDISTNEGKIDYLLERVSKANLVFIRNQKEYNGYEAARFLRWKLNRHRDRYNVKIDTAEDFIDKIATVSRTTGQSYTVEISGTGKHLLGQVLSNELDELYQCITDMTQRAETPTDSVAQA